MSRRSKNRNRKSGRHSAGNPYLGFFIDASTRAGALDADDDAYLQSGFLDIGLISRLENRSSNESLLVGRTGAGKTALLRKLEDRNEKSIFLNPRELALNYVSESTVLQLLSELEVNLDNFFEVLWKHIICVELLRQRYGISNQQKQNAFWNELQRLWGSGSTKLLALEYLSEFGDKFWVETEERVKELIRRTEENVKSELGVSLSSVLADLGGTIGNETSEAVEQRSQIRSRSRQVVELVQLKKLAKVLESLDDIFDDDQQPYFLLIDFLDKNWVDDKIKFDLILSLFEVVKSFRRIDNVKIIVAVRRDLLDLVFQHASLHKKGFQRDKINSLLIPVQWSVDRLREFAVTRTNLALAENRSSSNKPPVSHVFPTWAKSATDGIDYIVERTLLRPRELIDFLNKCFEASQGKQQVTKQAIKQVEPQYSNALLDSVSDEWREEFPDLREISRLLENRESPFAISSIDESIISDFTTDYYAACIDGTVNPATSKLLSEYRDGRIKEIHVSSYLVRILYRAGIVGIKPGSKSGVEWATINQPIFVQKLIRPEARIYVHLAFHRALGIEDQRKAS